MFYKIIRDGVEYLIGVQNNDQFSVITRTERVVEIFSELNCRHIIDGRHSYQAIVSDQRLHIKKLLTPRMINFLLDNVLANEKCSGRSLCFGVGGFGFVGISKREYDYYTSKCISY